MNNTDRAMCKANMDRAARALAGYEAALADSAITGAERAFLCKAIASNRAYIQSGRNSLLSA